MLVQLLDSNDYSEIIEYAQETSIVAFVAPWCGVSFPVRLSCYISNYFVGE